ncbi:phosphoadenosine phosphosulfate reductase, partial [Polychytrium aggregatum]|uniref:phosphoadenosine phosphosulfate reductase n=1 Tax=Polychytrium aggregatum TaxID=110093 RepID=UPI0022FE372F
PFSPSYVEFLNKKLATLTPQQVLEWAIVSIPNLYQTTAFGLTGSVVVDMISKISSAHSSAVPLQDAQKPNHLVPLVFIDTLYHFKETVDLANRVAEHYGADIHVYRPEGTDTVEEFEKVHGEKLWETQASAYDYLVKVEPARRAYAELNVQAVITGRRRSQGGDRAQIPILEIDDTASPPLLKLNPLASWDFKAVWDYITENKVPYNPLVDQGYKSIGDWHSTQIPKEGESEREGRWRNQNKTECGLHKNYFQMRAAYLAAKKRKLE